MVSSSISFLEYIIYKKLIVNYEYMFSLSNLQQMCNSVIAVTLITSLPVSMSFEVNCILMRHKSDGGGLFTSAIFFILGLL